MWIAGKVHRPSPTSSSSSWSSPPLLVVRRFLGVEEGRKRETENLPPLVTFREKRNRGKAVLFSSTTTSVLRLMTRKEKRPPPPHSRRRRRRWQAKSYTFRLRWPAAAAAAVATAVTAALFPYSSRASVHNSSLLDDLAGSPWPTGPSGHRSSS